MILQFIAGFIVAFVWLFFPRTVTAVTLLVIYLTGAEVWL